MRNKVRKRWTKVTIRVHKETRMKGIVEKNLKILKNSKIKKIKEKKAIILLFLNTKSIKVLSTPDNLNNRRDMIVIDTHTQGINNLNSCLLHLLTPTILMYLKPLQFLINLTCTPQQCIIRWWFLKNMNTSMLLEQKRKGLRTKRSDNDETNN